MCSEELIASLTQKDSPRNMSDFDKSVMPYAYNSLGDRIAHFEIVKEQE